MTSDCALLGDEHGSYEIGSRPRSTHSDVFLRKLPLLSPERLSRLDSIMAADEVLCLMSRSSLTRTGSRFRRRISAAFPSSPELGDFEKAFLQT